MQLTDYWLQIVHLTIFASLASKITLPCVICYNFSEDFSYAKFCIAINFILYILLESTDLMLLKRSS